VSSAPGISNVEKAPSGNRRNCGMPLDNPSCRPKREDHRNHYSTVRLHSALAMLPRPIGSVTATSSTVGFIFQSVSDCHFLPHGIELHLLRIGIVRGWLAFGLEV
jgi:hypothetical protein